MSVGPLASVAVSTLLCAGLVCGQGIGGVVKSNTPTIPASGCGKVPRVLKAGTLVAFGSGLDWSDAVRRNGMIRVSVRDAGKLTTKCTWLPEEAIEVFEWQCGEPERTTFGVVKCSPISGHGFSDAEWEFRFVLAGRKVAESLGVTLREELSPADYAPVRGTPTPVAPTPEPIPSDSTPPEAAVEPPEPAESPTVPVVAPTPPPSTYTRHSTQRHHWRRDGARFSVWP